MTPTTIQTETSSITAIVPLPVAPIELATAAPVISTHLANYNCKIVLIIVATKHLTRTPLMVRKLDKCIILLFMTLLLVSTAKCTDILKEIWAGLLLRLARVGINVDSSEHKFAFGDFLKGV